MNDKQRRFVDQYLLDLNATQAAIRAGYSPKTAQEQASRLLSNVMVSEEIQRRLKSNARDLKELRKDVLDRLAEIAFSNLGDVITWDHRGVKVVPNANLRILKSLDYEKGSVKVSLHDVLKALEILCKHLGLLAPPRTTLIAKTSDAKARLKKLVRRMNDRADHETL